MTTMEKSSVLLLCIVVTCSVWAVNGRSLEISIDDEDVEVEDSPEVGKLPGLCWACKWALEKVKKSLGANATAESIKEKLNSICNQMGLLKNLCRKFVKSHLGVLIEELTTSDGVRTICVRTKACKPKEFFSVIFDPNDDDDDSDVEITGYH